MISADVCVVGAGPAGITVAQELEARGLRVCLVEGGGEHIQRRVQRDFRGESDGYPLRQLDRARLQVFGGSLRSPRVSQGGWVARPLDAIDFEARPGIPHTGWPFTRAGLEPYYTRAQAHCGLGRYCYEPAGWLDPRFPGPLTVGEHGVVTEVFQRGERPFPDALQRFRRSDRVQVLMYSRVVGLDLDRGGRRVEVVRFRHPDGSTGAVRARVVVLAAGGIENARLLLCGDNLRGLGNEHDLVGRYFAARLYTNVGRVVSEHPDLLRLSGFYDVHEVGPTPVQGVFRLADDVLRERGLLNCVFFLSPRPAAVNNRAVRSLSTLRKVVMRRPLWRNQIGHLANLLRGLPDLGRLVLTGQAVRQRELTVLAQGEQAPNPESRVCLGSHRDSAGLPVARVTWKISTADTDSMRSSLRLVDHALHASHLGHIQDSLGADWPTPLMEASNHHMGATRMHVDPRQGVVDADCRVHSMRNLFVTGSSVFPTYGASNPTLTIVALALKLADHLSAFPELGGFL